MKSFRISGSASPPAEPQRGEGRAALENAKGCLDECDTCEDSRKLSIELNLKNKALQNNLLAKQIELLEQSQEYRCCPVGEIEELEEA